MFMIFNSERIFAFLLKLIMQIKKCFFCEIDPVPSAAIITKHC